MGTPNSNIRSLQLKYSRALERVDNWDEDICRLEAQMNRTDCTSVQYRGLSRRLSMMKNLRNSFYSQAQELHAELCAAREHNASEEK